MTHITGTIAEDAGAILAIARSEPLFTPQEAAIVAELLRDYIEREDRNGYFFLSAYQDSELVGFACYGPTPMTHGTYDLYWIAVASAWKGHGIGRQLLEAVEQRVRQLDGHLLVLDTSGRTDYAGTRAFYERLGFVRTAIVPDFYDAGDDLVIYTHHLPG
ncbi:MAG: GNAT family N-acetyltransferase [Anaerolineales bacterium]|jgi:ribosomal protein S18 acetylase RimI-like enzyme